LPLTGNGGLGFDSGSHPSQDEKREGQQGSIAKRWSRRTGAQVKGKIESRGVELIYPVGALAREIADNTSQVSVALIRQMLWKMAGADHPMEAHKVDSRGIFARGSSADVKEGVASFLEKRPAKFPDKVSKDMPPYFPWWKERKYS